MGSGDSCARSDENGTLLTSERIPIKDVDASIGIDQGWRLNGLILTILVELCLTIGL